MVSYAANKKAPCRSRTFCINSIQCSREQPLIPECADIDPLQPAVLLKRRMGSRVSAQKYKRYVYVLQFLYLVLLVSRNEFLSARTPPSAPGYTLYHFCSGEPVSFFGMSLHGGMGKFYFCIRWGNGHIRTRPRCL